MPHAAKVENNIVVDVIVGTSGWATQRLGGVWVDINEGEASVGYLVVDGGFREPSPFPSWTWDGTEYQPPVPMPEPVEGYYWSWDEDAQEWKPVEG